MEEKKVKQKDIKISEGEAKIVKEVLDLEKSNIEAHRIAKNGKKTIYEEQLGEISKKFTSP